MKGKDKEPPWKDLFLIMCGGCSSALWALRAGSPSTAREALEKAFSEVEKVSGEPRTVPKDNVSAILHLSGVPVADD